MNNRTNNSHNNDTTISDDTTERPHTPSISSQSYVIPLTDEMASELSTEGSSISSNDNSTDSSESITSADEGMENRPIDGEDDSHELFDELLDNVMTESNNNTFLTDSQDSNLSLIHI